MRSFGYPRVNRQDIRHPGMVNEESVGQANEAYETAEQAYLAALASGAEEGTLRTLAQRAVGAAKEWESVDAAVPPLADMTRYYDAPEVLATLWSDLADAYERRLR